MDKQNGKVTQESHLSNESYKKANTKDSRDTCVSEQVIYEELNNLQHLFNNQASQITLIESKLKDFLNENQRLKEKISDFYNKKLVESLAEINLTHISWCDDKEFFDKIDADEIKFEELFEATIEPTNENTKVSELADYFVFISHTVLNF
jgi:hypothetical protein